MSSRFARLRRPAAALVAVAAGGAVAYTAFRPKALEFPTIELKRDTNGRIVPPKFSSIKSRAEQIADLRRNSSDDELYDLLVIGGGATGTGIAIDAATRGLKVALVERDDFSSGTSSKSTKLVHGGVRYLEKAVWNLDYPQLQLVMEALRERKTFLEIAPHLSQSLPILLPWQRWWQAPYFWFGTKAYDLLAGSQGLESSYYMSKSKALEAFPLLKKDSLLGALVYYDGQHNDSRMNIALALTAAFYGATVVNHMEVMDLEKDASGKIRGARLRDVSAMTNGDNSAAREFTVRAKGVINATGPFTDSIERMDDVARKSLVAPSSGAHIILPPHLSPNGMGMLDAATSDGRVVFVLPWQGFTLAGTTDTPCAVEREPIAKQDEIDFILKEVSKLLAPDVKLSRSDILATWSGIRPLVRDPNAKNTESLVRSHLVTVSDSGLLTCAGGKWTTYRQMAEDAVDEAIKTFNLTPKVVSMPNIDGQSLSLDAWTTSGKCQTREVRLIGAHGFSDKLHNDLMQHFSLEADVAQHLAANYGDRAWDVAAQTPMAKNSRLCSSFPLIEAEIRYGVRQEYAQTATDFLARRTRVAFLDVNSALEILPRVIDVMAEELHWTSARKEHEWTETVHFLRSMGLPQEKFGITRDDVLKGKHRTALRSPELSTSPSTSSVGIKMSGGLAQLETGTTLARSGTLSPPEA